MTHTTAAPPDVRKVSDLPGAPLDFGAMPRCRVAAPGNFESKFRWSVATTAHQTAAETRAAIDADRTSTVTSQAL
jgi:hypothetical protein